jgi:predicted MarR family transcription regulator
MRRKLEDLCFMGNAEEIHKAAHNMKKEKKLYNQQGSYEQYSSYSKRERKREIVYKEYYD